MSNKHIFWQYPVITEKTFNIQSHEQGVQHYVGFPWATAIDKKMNLQFLEHVISQKVDKHNFNITCCQHIYFRRLIRLFRVLGIKMLYTPHKVYGEDQIEGIIIKPCPLFAVNVEDPSRNRMFDGVDFINIERKYLYTFQGALQEGYLTDIRKRIFELPRKPDIEIRYIGGWHFNEIVYSENQSHEGKVIESEKHSSNTDEYNKLLLQSTFSLCPSGTGPNSIRFWESLAVGAIPVILADELELPEHPLWAKSVLRIPESKVGLLDSYLRSISKDEIKTRATNCLKIYHYFRNNYRNTDYDPYLNTQQIIHYCCGSYEMHDYGGVATYDYQLKKCFPRRRFFKGPEHKDKMLAFLKSCSKPPIVFTDNHLACDIPNEYFVFLVHHGCARTTADANPSWDEYWKNMCTVGQDLMLKFRDPKTTHIISIADYVTEKFTKYYGDEYLKFERTKVLHYSSFNETVAKHYDYDVGNKKFVVFGNFGGKKGDVSRLIKSNLSNTFLFRQMNIRGSSFNTVKEFNDAKQAEYLKADMFLQISNSEGNSYASLDAALSGLAIVSTPVGLFFEVPDDCYVNIEIDRMYDVEYMHDKLKFGWENRKALGNKIRNWVKNNCREAIWTHQMKMLVERVTG